MKTDEFSGKLFSAICLFLIAYALFFICVNPLRHSGFGIGSDEGYYVAYAMTVAAHGPEAINDLVDWYGSSDEARKHPAPSRIGYVLPMAGMFSIFGASFEMLGLVSLLSFLVFIAMNWYFCRRHFGQTTALIATVLLASSPLLLGLSRRALLDAPLNLLWGLLVWLFVDILERPAKLKACVFIIVLSYAITLKEMSIILVPFFLLMGCWAHYRWQSRVSLTMIFLMSGGALLLTLTAYFLALGGWDPLARLIKAIATTHLAAHQPNPYAVLYCSGPWFKYVLDFLLLSPAVTLLSCARLGTMAVSWKQVGWKEKVLLGYAVYVLLLLGSLKHSKVVRIVSNVEMVMALMAALLLVQITAQWPPSRRKFWLSLFVLGLFALGWQGFIDVFYRPGLLDPITHHLVALRGLVP